MKRLPTRILLWRCCQLLFLACLFLSARPVSAQTLTNDDVIAMAQAKLGDTVIIAKIRTSSCQFDTSTSALIKLKQAGISDSVLQAMAEATPSGSAQPNSVTSRESLPNALGFYILERNNLRGLKSTEVSTRMGLIAGAGIGSNLGYAVDGFEGEPPSIVQDLSPIIIIFQQNIDVNTFHLSRLTFVSAMKAYQFNITGTQPQFFRNVYGRDYNDTVQVGLWRPKDDVPVRIEPVEGKNGMFRLVPNSSLLPGKYSLYQSGAIHADNMIFATGPGRRSQAFYFGVGGSPSASGSPPSIAASNLASSCNDYEACIDAGASSFQSSDWSTATSYFEAATKRNPSSGGAWAWLGKAYLGAGRTQDAPTAWDKALQLGAVLTFTACHGRGIRPCETGELSLGSKEISFAVNGEKLFTQAPSQVAISGKSSGILKVKASFGLEVDNKKYTFDFFPVGVSCGTGSFLHCPEDGVKQQAAISEYISRTIPKLASGELAQ